MVVTKKKKNGHNIKKPSKLKGLKYQTFSKIMRKPSNLKGCPCYIFC